MEWIIVLILVVIGFFLLIIEFLVLPGVNVAGIIGFACVCFGVYLGYKFFGTKAGNFILLATALGGFVVTWYALRAQTWKKLSLHSSIDSTVEGVDESVKVGDCGICLGRLSPMGKVKIGEVVVEALSQSGYIDSRAEVEVVKVYKDKLIVKLNKEKDG